jgi:hypothetical protein
MPNNSTSSSSSSHKAVILSIFEPSSSFASSCGDMRLLCDRGEATANDNCDLLSLQNNNLRINALWFLLTHCHPTTGMNILMIESDWGFPPSHV